MPRLSLLMRFALLVMVALSAVWILAFAVYLRNQSDFFVDPGPEPMRLLAIAEQFDITPTVDYPRLIAAIGSDRLSLAVLADEPPQPPFPPAGREVRARYAGVLGDRLIEVFEQPAKGPGARFSKAADKIEKALAFHLRLGEGRVLAVTASNPAIFNRFGFPVGLGAGLFGTAVAFIALLLMQRETRPLRQLAVAVDKVDFLSEPVPMPETRRSAPEIRGVIAAFNRLQERLHVVLKARMALIGGISHDVRTFAARLRLRIDGIEDETERQRAEADIRDMIRLLDDALLSSRAGAGELLQELVEIGPLVAGEVDDRQRQGVPIDLKTGAAVMDVLVLGDRLALRRVIANLIDNALKYGGVAHLEMIVADGAVMLVVDDEGPGIAPDQRQLLLEPFVRLEQSRNRATGGAGLGLAIARTLVVAHGGALEISEATGGGARLIVTLPLFRSEDGKS